MKKIMFGFVFVTLLFSTSFGYTLTVNYGDYSLTRDGINSGTSVSLGLDIPFVVSSNVSSLEVTRSSSRSAEILMPESNVIVTLEPATKYTSSLTLNKYIKLCDGPESFTVSTNVANISISVKNTICRVVNVNAYSSSGSKIVVNPVKSLGTIRFNKSSNIYLENAIVNKLVSTGFFTTGSSGGCGNSIHSGFSYWLFEWYDDDYDSIRCIKCTESSHAVGWLDVAYSSASAGVSFNMYLADLLIVGGNGTSISPYLVFSN